MLNLPTRSLAGILLTWSLIIGCESKKAPTTAETVAASATPKLLPDTPVVMHVSAADTAAAEAQDDRSEDVPALHIPFEERKTVAPGLVVIVKSIRPADTAIIREPSDLKLTFTIKRNSKVIYCDTTDDGLMYDYYALPTTQKLYPIWVPTGAGNGELLVAFNHRPALELTRRFHILNDQVAKIDTLLTFDGPARDWDNDGKKEFRGMVDYSQMWDDEHGQRFITYDPTLYYEITPAGLVLDSALTKRKVKEEYGVFKGFASFEKPGFLVSKLPKGSRKRL